MQWFRDEEDTDCWATWESHLQLFESAFIQGFCSQAFFAWKILIHFLNTSKYLIHRWQKPRRVFFPCFFFLLIFYLICFVIQRLKLPYTPLQPQKKKEKKTHKEGLSSMQPIWEVHIRTVFWLVSNNGHIKVRSNQDDPDGRISDGGDLNCSNCYRSFALVLHTLCQSTTL